VKKILISFLIVPVVFAFTLRKYDTTPKSNIDLKRIIYSYKKDEVIDTLREFVKNTRPTRMVGSDGHHKATTFLYDWIKKNTNGGEGELLLVDNFKPNVDFAIDMYLNDFAQVKKSNKKFSKKLMSTWKNFTDARIKLLNKLRSHTGKNIVWEKKGVKHPDEVIVIGAHYDSIAYNKSSLMVNEASTAPGADNNGSGVAIALNLIEFLSEIQLQRTVRVVFFDYTEIGFLGSYDYAKKLAEEKANGLKVHGYIDLLMLGYDTKLNDLEKRYYNLKLYRSTKEQGTYKFDRELADSFAQRAKLASASIKFTQVEKKFKNGDAQSFIMHGFPSITFSQNWESDFNAKRIHTPQDYVETLNLETIYRAFRYITFGVSHWALGL
jgi:hypothetical protein